MKSWLLSDWIFSNSTEPQELYNLSRQMQRFLTKMSFSHLLMILWIAYLLRYFVYVSTISNCRFLSGMASVDISFVLTMGWLRTTSPQRVRKLLGVGQAWSAWRRDYRSKCTRDSTWDVIEIRKCPKTYKYDLFDSNVVHSINRSEPLRSQVIGRYLKKPGLTNQMIFWKSCTVLAGPFRHQYMVVIVVLLIRTFRNYWEVK